MPRAGAFQIASVAAFFQMIFPAAEQFRQPRKIHRHPPGLVSPT
jgi:hypothetical protein